MGNDFLKMALLAEAMKATEGKSGKQQPQQSNEQAKECIDPATPLPDKNG